MDYSEEESTNSIILYPEEYGQMIGDIEFQAKL